MSLDTRELEQQFFPFVKKPDRYTGGELYLPPLPESPEIRAALAFPDLYELGMSYLGLRLLLHRALQVEGVACERVFMPWFDAEARLRALNLPLFTLETRTPLRELDLLGINLQYELHATNVLALLDLGGIPLRAEHRSESDPVVLGGGPLALHGEPFAPFFDALALGDGEDLFPEILHVLKEQKRRGASRRTTVRALGDIPGVYLPGYYQPQYGPDGRFRGMKRLDPGLPEVVSARVTPRLLPEHYPAKPLVPSVEATHNRLILEIARGCSRGCRFCGPGMTNRPVRERPVADIVAEAAAGLEATGYSEISLLSLSIADYSCLETLLDALRPILEARQVSLSFPSLRPDRFTPQMADRAAAGSRTGLTLAPEAASERLRAIINKETTDQDLLRAVRLAYERRWKSVKLYFMAGLPGETDDDLYAMVDLVREVVMTGKGLGGRHVTVSVSPFTPKPHTPFEREGQAPPEGLRRRLGILTSRFGRWHAVKLELRDLDVSRMEAAIARGDRRTAEAIEASFRAGGRFDAWTDGFSMTRWEQAFRQAGLDPEAGSRRIPEDEPTPWDHLQPGVTEEFLQSEREAAAAAEFTSDCRRDVCHMCGLHQRSDLPCPEIPRLEPYIPAEAAASPPPGEFRRYRLTYRRREAARYVSHLDAVGVLERALRRLGLPLEFTQGMKPHPWLIASPPLPVGMTSRAEYLDFGLAGDWTPDRMANFREGLPPGFEAVDVAPLSGKGLSLGSLNVFLYRAEPAAARPAEQIEELQQAVEEFLASESVLLLRTGPQKAQPLEARGAVWRLEAQVGGALWIGLKTSGGPTPKAVEILGWLTRESADEIISGWRLERVEMGWDLEGRRLSPSEPVNRETLTTGEST
ncbi:MAG: TIGR03960 family B12-binding radical SAM protein [Candidatus Zixiibacteriota bacterium]|nr:MAG: TIGR03960 family B12-binding radical SAM protein [candidate division Zixibacteria bacterium]